MRRVRYLLMLAIVCVATVSCVDKNHSTDRYDAALRDPFEYEPTETPTVSGGGTADFDRKAFKRDWDRFWK